MCRLILSEDMYKASDNNNNFISGGYHIWHVCQSNIWSSFTKVDWQLNRHKLVSVYTEQVRSPYTEHAASGLPNRTPLEGEVRFVQAQDQQVVTTRSPEIITECLLTRSMLIKVN